MGKAPKLEIITLGGCTILLDGEPVQGLASRKADALFVYLAVTERAHSREHLATLLWDDRPLARSLANLSVLLTSLKKQLEPYLIINRKLVSYKPLPGSSLDVRRLTEQIKLFKPEQDGGVEHNIETRQALGEVLATYRGDFMQGFNLRDAHGFEEWMLLEKERVQFEVIAAYELLIDSCNKHGDFNAGILLSRRLLEIDPLREGTHSKLITMLARMGDRVEAMKQYHVLEELLKQELELEPESSIKDMFERIRSSENAVRHNLPPESEMLFGRDSDLSAIHSRLQDPNCRLVTVLGPGGIGKSSLARRVARESAERFINGAFVVSLSPVESAQYLPQFICNSMGFVLQGDESPQEQLINYLREKEVLLVLDNFEHLLGGVGLLMELLEHAPDLKILVTSRERLKHEQEWIYPLEGLHVTGINRESNINDDVLTKAVRDNGALALFEYAARKVKPGYRINQTDLPHAVQMCQLVEGMPLGIELGAAWLRGLPISEIASQMASDVEFLMGKGGTGPDKPQRMKAVFDRSWVLLNPEEQLVFKKLSIFEGGFSLEAGMQIAGAGVSLLASLVDKSMLRFIGSPHTGEEARYDIHELVRQYAFLRLREDKPLLMEISTRHCRYFCLRLHDLAPELNRTDQLIASQRVEGDLGNILAAWHWACEGKMLTEIEAAIGGLFRFYLFRGWFNQGAEEFKFAIDHLEHDLNDRENDNQLENIVSKLRSRLGVFRSYLSQNRLAEKDLGQSLLIQRRQGNEEEIAFTLKWAGTSARMATRYAEAIGYLEEAIAYLERLDNTVLLSEAYNELGAVALRQSRYDVARANFEQSIQIKEGLEDAQGVARSLINLGIVAFRTGDYEGAKQRTTESLEISRKIGDQWGIAASLNNLGFAEEHLGHNAIAKDLYQESLEVKRFIGHRKGMAYSMLNLAMIAYHAEDYTEALETNLKAKKILEKIKDRWGLASAHQQLGRTYLALEQHALAWDHFCQALEIGLDIETPMYVSKSMVGIAEVNAAQGEYTKAYLVISAILLQANLDPEAEERASNLGKLLERKIPDQRRQELFSGVNTETLWQLAHDVMDPKR